MTRLFYATLAVVCLGCDTPAFSQAEKPFTAEWVPFVAKLVQKTEIEGIGGPYTVAASGVFLRDKHGSWYRRTTLASSRLPITGATDTAFLFDRVNLKYYLLDFTRKTSKALQVSASAQPWFGISPMSSQAFEQDHS